MYERTLRFTKAELIYIVVSVLLFFQIYLQKIIQPLQFFDELITMLCIAQIVGKACFGRLEKSWMKMILVMIFVVAIGVIGNLTSDVQTQLKPIVTDVGNTFKVFVTYIGASIYAQKVKSKKKVLDALAVVMHVFVVILFICMLAHESGIVTMGMDIRYGLKSFQFINNGAGQLSLMFYSIIFVMTARLLYLPPQKRHLEMMYIAMALLVWISTLRSRAFMYVLIYLFLYWKLVVSDKKFSLNLQNGIVILLVLILFGADQFETYFANTKTARSNLMVFGIYTMRRFFPIGAGFATYGTDAAASYYSKLYEQYGFEYVYGLSKENPMFASDTYWAAIFGEFGVLGTVLIVMLLFFWCMDVYKKTRYNKIALLIGVFVCVTQVSASAATSVFFHFITVGLFFLVPLAFQPNNTLPERLIDGSVRRKQWT